MTRAERFALLVERCRLVLEGIKRGRTRHQLAILMNLKYERIRQLEAKGIGMIDQGLLPIDLAPSVLPKGFKLPTDRLRDAYPAPSVTPNGLEFIVGMER